MKPTGKPTDSRKLQSGMNRSLLWLVLGVLVIGGTALMYFAYGPQAGLVGGVCLVGGGGLVLMVYLVVVVLGKIAGEE